MTIKRYTAEEAKNLKSNTDWEEVRKLTDEEIREAALDDPDAQPLTEEELKKFKRVVPRKDGEGYEHDKNKNSD